MDTDNQIVRAAEEVVDAEIACDEALARVETLEDDAKEGALREWHECREKRDEALSRLARLLGKVWPQESG